MAKLCGAGSGEGMLGGVVGPESRGLRTRGSDGERRNQMLELPAAAPAGDEESYPSFCIVSPHPLRRIDLPYVTHGV